ncbi:MAG: NAD(P)-dependent oxidoreductase [Candidatus Lindowbacteria bacterium]|nr:NAD(P)-dependent oxidoreductase [Candidatus Lindowbacteria bacterium]
MTQSILVTGGAGYLGSVLVPELLKAGHKVTVLDSLMFRQTGLLGCSHEKNFTLVQGDARNEETLKELIPKADTIIPLAALVGAPLCDRDPISAMGINRDAIKLITEMASPNQQVIYPCTNSGYGIGEKDTLCTEESPLKPISLYGRSKVEAEAIVKARDNSITFRFATVFGLSPRMRLDLLVNDFTFRALSDKTLVLFEAHFKRNFLHIRDVARVFMYTLDHFDTMKNETYNVGLSEANLSKRELAEKIKEHIPDLTIIEAEFAEDPDKRDYIVSNAKIEAHGFQTQYSLDDGIQEIIRAYPLLCASPLSNI